MDRDEMMWYTVGWNDVDALGHMTSSRYAGLYDDIRWQWVRKVKDAAPELGEFIPVVVEAHILYKRELSMGTKIAVHTHLDRTHGKALIFKQEIRTAEGIVASTAEYVTLLLDIKARRAVAIPDAFRRLFPDVPSTHATSAAKP